MKLRELLRHMQEVQQKIGTSVPYICGGTPRDKFMGRLDNVADIDITTGDKTVDYLSQEFAQELRKRYNVTRKTMEDGHSTIFIGNLKVDFSSNFVVPGIDQYLSKVGIAKPTSMQREMFSRDFTCNSLLLTMDLKQILDPTKRGFADIRAKTIKTCLAPEVTLTSNRNRVIRAIYLACKLGFEVDPAIVEFVKANPQTVKLSTTKAMHEKLNQAFSKDPEKAARLLSQMNLWQYIPITEKVYPYYMKVKSATLLFNIKKAEDENDGPNFDYGDGAYTAMSEGKKMKSITDAPHKSPGAFFTDDNEDHMMPPKEHGTSIYDWKNSPYQGKPKAPKKRDTNNIDFPIDDEVNHDTLIRPEEGQYHQPKFVGPSGTDDLLSQPSNEGTENIQIEFTSPQIAGEHSYVPEHDFDGRSDDALNFGRDYDDESAPIGRTWDENSVIDKELDLDRLEAKYLPLEPHETEIYGLPDGVGPEGKDADQTIQTENPYDTISDSGRQMYEDKWNI